LILLLNPIFKAVEIKLSAHCKCT